MLLAVSLTILLASCAQSSEPVAVPPAPQLPALPAYLSQECQDPGVDPDAKVALFQHRQAWAECRQRHSLLVRFYNELADLLGLRTKIE